MLKQEKKILINGVDALIRHLKKHSSQNIGKRKKGFYEMKRRIVNKTFKNFEFRGDFQGIEFRSCRFTDCEFNGIWGFYFILKNCKFSKCGFRNSRYSHLEFNWNNIEFNNCYFRNIEWDEGSIINMWFTKCSLMSFGMHGINPMGNVHFIECEIEESNFESLQYYGDGEEIDTEFPDLFFEECSLYSTYFNSVDLRNSYFLDTIIFKSSFVDCKLSSDSITITKELKYKSYATLDFQTLLKSDFSDKNILQSYFGIPREFDYKKIVSNMIEPKIFSTVFISYSFKDSVFASRINEALNKKSIRTFLWEKDAKGGARLDDIMTSGINAHDKLLFIASENSIRSKACQYELTTARKKQEQSWKNVFFPIFIDDYLFKVKKSDIRPVDLANEYWENIEEIKRVNALNFSKFNISKINEKEFDGEVEKIIQGLKIES